MRIRSIQFLRSLILLSLSFEDSIRSQPKLPGLAETIESLRQEWMIPGLAVILVKDNEIVFREGFGHRDIERNLPFTPITMQLVASTTKSFTSALVAQLVDEGIVEWRHPVRDYHPDFKMYDNFATENMTLEDMMSHRSGLPLHETLLAVGVDRELLGSPRGFRENLIRRLRHFEPSDAFRTHFQYQDVIYTSVGGIIEYVMNTSYEKLVDERLLKPLEMTQTTFSRKEAMNTGNFAQHYAKIGGKITAIEYYDPIYFSPSTGLFSNADEMIKWVQFALNKGKLGDRQLISAENLEWTHRPHMAVGNDLWGGFFGTNQLSYGQGWFQSNHRGYVLVSDVGSFNGHRTAIGFVPEINAGVVVLCNLNSTIFMQMVELIVFDKLLGIEKADEWNEYYLNYQKQGAVYAEERSKRFAANRDLTNKPAYELKAYTGTFTHPGYGAFKIEKRGDKLFQTFDERTNEIKPYNGKVFETIYHSTENDRHHFTMTFESDKSGKVVAVRIPIVPRITEPRFIRD